MSVFTLAMHHLNRPPSGPTPNWHGGDADLIADAEMSRAAYSGATEVNGWQKDVQLSGPDHAVFHKDGKAKIAYRGTNVKNKRDLGTDALIALGLQDKSSRMKRAVRTADQVTAKYGKGNVSLTGHSLGGSQSQYVSRKRGLEATGFNAAMSPIDALRSRTYSKFHSISTASDPISKFTHHHVGKIGKKTTARQTKWNPHGLSNYI
jgi:hypothetical protein